MSAATKGLSEKIVDKCIENPKLAFLLIPLGIALIYWGVTDAKYYKALGGRPTQTMSDVSIVSKPNDRGFTIPHVVGKAKDKEVSIPSGMRRKASFGFSMHLSTIFSESPFVAALILHLF